MKRALFLLAWVATTLSACKRTDEMDNPCAYPYQAQPGVACRAPRKLYLEFGWLVCRCDPELKGRP